MNLEVDRVEKALLGLMVSDPEAITSAASLEVGDLFLDSHRTLLTVIRAMDAQGEKVSLITLLAELGRRKLTESLGGAGYISDLTNDAWRGQDPAQYLKIIKKEATRRKVLALCEIMRARAEDGDEPDDIYHDLQTSALEAQTSNAQIRPVSIAEYVLPTWEDMKRQMDHTGDVLGIPTGLSGFDRATTGWREGELTYVGASPGQGKTSFMLQAMHYAASGGFGVGCISLEMRAGQLMRRLTTIESGLQAYKTRDPRELSIPEREHVRRSLFALGDLPIQMCDQSGLKPGQIASLARQMHSRGARIIFVDFVQIIVEEGRDRREAINRVSAALRDTCKILNIPFVVASQLARRTGDPNTPPKMSDLRESGNLEQDAHNVHMLFRPKQDGHWTGQDLILIEKQREGLTGPIEVAYDPASLTFVERNTKRERAA